MRYVTKTLCCCVHRRPKRRIARQDQIRWRRMCGSRSGNKRERGQVLQRMPALDTHPAKSRSLRHLGRRRRTPNAFPAFTLDRLRATEERSSGEITPNHSWAGTAGYIGDAMDGGLVSAVLAFGSGTGYRPRAHLLRWPFLHPMCSLPASERLARALAGGFGCGRVPRAEGTVASALATLVAGGLLAISPALLPLGVGLALLSGFWAISRLGVTDDPGWVVVDEIAGQWIALLAAIRAGPLALIAGFVFFRLFDILKPGPIRWAERLPGAAGVMADDVLAGAAAALLLLAARLTFPAAAWF